MKIAYFTEMGWEGKVDRTTHNNMRTEFAWMSALDADHYNVHAPKMKHDYDLGVVIVPKNNPEFNMATLKKHCDKIAIQQEGPHWYFQDYPLTRQFHFHNYLMEADYIFAHNESDKKYYRGITSKPVFVMRSLMIADDMTPKAKGGTGKVIMGGNFVSWYGGFDSYMVASVFQPECEIYAPSMGRKQKMEDQIEDINYLHYQLWKEWIGTLANFEVGIHLMRTHAAGTFSMNLAYHGTPCIGYEGLDTQDLLHPQTTVEVGNIAKAQSILKKLYSDKFFYHECSEQTKELFDKYYSEEAWLDDFQKVNKEFKNG